jgi:hypothetical protein
MSLIQQVLVVGALALALAASACGVSPSSAGRHTLAAAGAPKQRARGGPRQPSEDPPAHHNASPGRVWPSLVIHALNAVPRTFTSELLAPAILPRGNSASISVDGTAYSVTVYACASPEPVNSPLLGLGTCGTTSNFAEAFGGTTYPSSHALTEATAYQTPPGPFRTMALPGGISAQRWVAPNATGQPSTLEIAWRVQRWHVVVAGSLSIRQTARTIARLLQHYRLPAGPGLLTVDAEADGLHTSLQWAVHDTLYFASATHTPAHALAMAASMQAYP